MRSLSMCCLAAGAAASLIAAQRTPSCDRGEIGPVESVLHQVPDGMDSGWSSWEDAMSSRARW